MAETSTYIAAIMQTYAPATTEAETTHWFSTDEIYAAIKDIDPGSKLTKDEVYQAMNDAGFRFQCRPGAVGINFRWMLRVK